MSLSCTAASADACVTLSVCRRARAGVALALQESISSFGGTLPLLDPIEHMKIEDIKVLDLIDRIEATERLLYAHPLHNSPDLHDAYARSHRRKVLRLELARKGPKVAPASAESSSSSDPAVDKERTASMRKALINLEYINADGVRLLKGRAACCIEAADELLTTEVLARGVLNRLTVPETVALLSCLLPGLRGNADRRRGPDSPQLPSEELTLL